MCVLATRAAPAPDAVSSTTATPETAAVASDAKKDGDEVKKEDVDERGLFGHHRHGAVVRPGYGGGYGGGIGGGYGGGYGGGQFQQGHKQGSGASGRFGYILLLALLLFNWLLKNIRR